MLLKKPFVVYGCESFLEYLRQMGFKTFWEYWDEDYDGYQGKERLSRLLSVIDCIAGFSTQQMINMLDSMKPILEHNYNLLINQAYTKKVSLIL